MERRQCRKLSGAPETGPEVEGEPDGESVALWFFHRAAMLGDLTEERIIEVMHMADTK